MTEHLIEQWNAMTPRERDAWIAEYVMGWTKEQTEENIWFEPISHLWKPLDHITNLPYYFADISAAMKAEEKIMQMGIVTQKEYYENLRKVVHDKLDFKNYYPFQVVHASAADRCAAMFLTINAINGKE
jgi:hypothetical protein